MALGEEQRELLLAEEGTPRTKHSDGYNKAFQEYSRKHVVQMKNAPCVAEASQQQGLTLARELFGDCYFTVSA